MPCPRCGANNFVGQHACWQCGHALPPPEEWRHAPAFGTAPVRGAASRRGRRWLATAGGATVAALAVLGALWLLRLRSAPPASPPRWATGRQAPTRPGTGASGADSVAPAGPLEAQARRELNRLYRETGYGPAPADAQGRIQLRSGGSISREERERARRSLGTAAP